MPGRTVIRVRYQETDAMGVAYYGNYLTWFEVARTEHMRRMGLAYREWEEQGYHLPVTEAHCQYLKPAHYDDELILTAALHVQGLIFRFDYEIRRVADGSRLAAGWTAHVCLNRQGRIDRAGTKRLAEFADAGGSREDR